MSNAIISVTEANFEKTITEANKPVLVDFWADWCGPCKRIAPIFEEVAQEYADKVIFAKLNVDQNPSISHKFGIRGIPTLLLFKEGQVIATHVAELSKLQLKTFLDNHL